MILLIDNYDSFVHNLARYFRQLGCPTQVVRNDAIDLDGIARLNPSAIVLSPGPCTPAEAGICLQLVAEYHQRTPLLGICLGHQAIIEGLGGTIERALEPMHGRASLVRHLGTPMFAGIGSPFLAGRYHSLVGRRAGLPPALRVTAEAEDQTIMAVEHERAPVVGLQFHPESILTECGYQLIANFLHVAGISRSHPDPGQLQRSNAAPGAVPAAKPYPPSSRLVQQELR